MKPNPVSLIARGSVWNYLMVDLNWHRTSGEELLTVCVPFLLEYKWTDWLWSGCQDPLTMLVGLRQEVERLLKNSWIGVIGSENDPVFLQHREGTEFGGVEKLMDTGLYIRSTQQHARASPIHTPKHEQQYFFATILKTAKYFAQKNKTMYQSGKQIYWIERIRCLPTVYCFQMVSLYSLYLQHWWKI